MYDVSPRVKCFTEGCSEDLTESINKFFDKMDVYVQTHDRGTGWDLIDIKYSVSGGRYSAMVIFKATFELSDLDR